MQISRGDPVARPFRDLTASSDEAINTCSVTLTSTSSLNRCMEAPIGPATLRSAVEQLPAEIRALSWNE
jgi:hypothetical protein